jgi:hypothetical protein
MNTQQASHEIANCWQCSHFAVSWDIKKPYSCRLMGFKSRVLPCFEVFNADGKACQCFQQKNGPASSLKSPTTLPIIPKAKSLLDTSTVSFWV